MPDPDLTAYLDGEADPAATARIEARLRDDPAVREAALALLRQRVLLARVMPGIAKAQTRRRPARPPSRSSRWWLYAVAGTAAAAGLAAMLVLAGGPDRAADAPPPADPLATTSATPAALAHLADGSNWVAGQRVVCERPLSATLADGARLELETGAILLVPATNAGTWRLERGTLRCVLPGTQQLVLATAQAEVRAEGADLSLAVDAEGTVLAVRTGTATATDPLTRTTVTRRAGSSHWVPADAVTPRLVDKAEGTVRGTVLVANARHVELATRFGTFRFTPRWLSGRKMLDPEMGANLARLARGQRVEITWFHEEHLRISKLRVLPPPGTDAVLRSEDF